MNPTTIAETEAAAQAALDAGDPATIAAAADRVDTTEQQTRKPEATLHQAALWYASQGIAVFPLRPGMKAPLPSCDRCRARNCPGIEECGHDLCHGLKGATTDPAKVADWWTRWPSANIGLPTGGRFDVVDIDGHPGQQSRVAHWEPVFAQIDSDALAKVLTPRPGGMHIYVPATGDGNAAGIVDGVDYRGAGGYVLAPPSVIRARPNGKDTPGRYRFIGTPNLTGRAA